jgi:hypothetical protein
MAKAKPKEKKKRAPQKSPKNTSPKIPHEGRDEKGSFLPGNRIWEARSSYGPKPKFDDAEVLWEACCEYFKWVEENPLLEQKIFHTNGMITKDTVTKMRAMTISGLCLFLDITLNTWKSYKENPVLLNIIEAAEQIIWNQKVAGAAADMLNANIICRELGLSDKTELTGKDGGPIQFSDTERAARLAAIFDKARDRRDRPTDSE